MNGLNDEPIIAARFDDDADTSVIGRNFEGVARGKWLGWLSSLALVAAIMFQLRSTTFESVTALLPHSSAFWLIFLASYLSAPLADWVIFRRLWGLSRDGLSPLFRKAVLNALVISYAGEAYFYAWTRSHVTGQRAPFGAIKDVAILSALVGNAATLILVLIAWPMLATIDLGIGRGPLVASIALLATISISMIVFRKKVFQLSRGDVAFVGIVHLARTILTVGLVALLWHLALPDIALRWWLLLSTGRMIVSRLPLIPNKDLAFAGVAAFVFQHNLQIVGLMAMTAMLIFAAHLVFGIGFIAGDFKQRITR